MLRSDGERRATWRFATAEESKSYRLAVECEDLDDPADESDRMDVDADLVKMAGRRFLFLKFGDAADAEQDRIAAMPYMLPWCRIDRRGDRLDVYNVDQFELRRRLEEDPHLLKHEAFVQERRPVPEGRPRPTFHYVELTASKEEIHRYFRRHEQDAGLFPLEFTLIHIDGER